MDYIYLMKRTLIVYGTFLGLFVFLLTMSEYWLWIKLNAFDYYIAATSCIFLIAGWWLSKKIYSERKEKIIDPAPLLNGTEFVVPSQSALEQSNLSKREMDVLVLMGQGMTNQEIADSLFVSQNTVKTHTNRIFEKLETKNRTQSIVKAKAQGLI